MKLNVVFINDNIIVDFKNSNLIKNVIKAFESLKMHILMMIFHVSLTVKKFLMFRYKSFLTHVLRAVRQLSLFLIHLT